MEYVAQPEIASPAGDPALRRIALTLRRTIWWLLAFSLAVGAASYLVGSESTETFRSDASIELTGDVPAGISSSGRGRVDARVEIEAQRRLLESGVLLDELRVDFGSQGDALLKVVTSNPELTPVIVVGIESDVEELASPATNSLIDLYLATRARETVARLEAELVPLREQHLEQETLIQSLVDELAVVRETGSDDEISVLENRTARALDRLDVINTAIQEREFRQNTVEPPVRLVEPARQAVATKASSLTSAIQLALLALFVAAGVVVTVSRLRGRLHLLDEVRAVIGPDVPILATVPKFRKKFRKVHTALVVGESHAQREAESFRYARSAVEVASNGLSPLSVLVTSSSANEGKTVTACNLALASSKSGRSTSILDADLLNASVAKVFRQPEMHSSFDALLAGAIDPAKKGKVRHDDEVDGLDLLLMQNEGDRIAVRTELSIDTVGDVFRKLKKSWDVVIVDGPPVLAVSDSMVLARAADATVLIVRMGRTTRRDLDTAMTQLRQSGVAIAGVIASHASERGESYYGYGYQYEAAK